MRPRHPFLLDRDKTVLVVVDLQEPFLRSVDQVDRVVARSIQLINAAQILNVPIIATTQYGSRMGGILPEVASALDGALYTVVDKLHFSCAANDAFCKSLLDLDRSQILLCGVETHICVLQTALDLIHLDYQAHVAADAVSSRTSERHQLGIDKLQRTGVIVDSAEGAMMEWLYEAVTEDFKAILRLIK